MSITGQKLLIPLLSCLPLKPLPDHCFVKMNENAFTKLLYSGQPVSIS